MKWRCEVCGYIHEGEAPPASCPECHATGDDFYNMDEEPQLDSVLEKDPDELEEEKDELSY